MRIAFYSSGGMSPQSAFTPALTFFPKRAHSWDEIAQKYSEHTIDVFAVLPASHLIDAKGSDILLRPSNVNYHVLPQDVSVNTIADIIADTHPDCAVAYSLPDAGLDWNPVRDAMVGEQLAQKGIRVLAHTRKTAMNCFKKYDTNRIVRESGYNAANGIYVQGLLYYADRRNPDIDKNVYKEYLRQRLSMLRFPVVVKPAAGSGSVGISIAGDVDEVIGNLDAIDIECDMVVEEKVEGSNFGIEIYGVPGNYSITEPVIFSMTGDGVTDPFASVKFGPVSHSKYKVDELKAQIEGLAGKMKFSGIAEIDLIFDGDKWHVIEINPRFSLLTAVGSAMRGDNIFDPLMAAAQGTKCFEDKPCKYTIDFKSDVLEDDTIEEIIRGRDHIKSVMKFECRVADGVDVGYCEWIMAAETKEGLKSYLLELQEAYPQLITETIMGSADQLGVM